MANEANVKVSAPAKKRPWFSRILIILVILFIVIQFFQPDKNNQNADMTNDISKVVNVPEDVHKMLKTSCYDCHSNNTVYPWYASIQPIGWWLKDHIDEGKQHLNFQDFASLQPRPGGRYKTAAELQDHKLEEVGEMIEEDEMPLKSYTLIHKDARLSPEQKKLLGEWVKTARTAVMESGSTAEQISPENE